VEQFPSDAPPAIKHYLLAFGICFFLWVLLTGSLNVQELIAGLVVALIVTLVAGPRLSILGGVRLTLSAPLHLVRYFL